MWSLTVKLRRLMPELSWRVFLRHHVQQPGRPVLLEPLSSAANALARRTRRKQRRMNSEQEEWLQAAVAAAQVGGRILQDWRGRFSVREKSRANLVTEADEASQRAIVELLAERFPQISVLAEENLDSRAADDQLFWIIDPLDGTSNYVHGFPYYAVSIALQVRGRVEVGVIHDPTRDETFTAVRGCGVQLDGNPVTCSGETQIDAAFGMASLPPGTTPDDPAVKRFTTALGVFRTVQRTGSAALNLAAVACGRTDAFWSTSLNAWDIAAGVLMVEEGGGFVSNLKGDAIDIFVPSLLAAASPELGRKIVKVLP